MRSPVAKLALGTVQFGIVYGVTNDRGQVPADEVAGLVEMAMAAGITLFDTAAAYGKSEAVPGALAGNRPALRFISKIPPVAASTIGLAEAEACRAAVHRSLTRLRRRSLYGLLLHRPNDVKKPGGERLVDLLQELKAAGEAERIGIAAYDADQIAHAATLFRPDLVQVPCSLLDQRLLLDGTLAHLKRLGTEVHVRSGFLQGVLLGNFAKLPDYFNRWREQLERVGRVAGEAGMSRLELSLRFLLDRPEIDHVVVGVTREAELAEIIAAANGAPGLPARLEALAVDDPALVNPALWPAA